MFFNVQGKEYCSTNSCYNLFNCLKVHFAMPNCMTGRTQRLIIRQELGEIISFVTLNDSINSVEGENFHI